MARLAPCLSPLRPSASLSLPSASRSRPLLPLPRFSFLWRLSHPQSARRLALTRQEGVWCGRRGGGRVCRWPLCLTSVNSGLTHPGKWFYALDATKAECRQHVASLMRHLTDDLGFRFLKLDFLHVASALGQRHDLTKTRAQALQVALATLRQGAGEQTFILGCSCPLGAAIGWVDAMRISADTSHHWHAFPVPWDRTNLPSGANMFRNVLVRQTMHGLPPPRLCLYAACPPAVPCALGACAILRLAARPSPSASHL